MPHTKIVSFGGHTLKLGILIFKFCLKIPAMDSSSDNGLKFGDFGTVVA